MSTTTPARLSELSAINVESFLIDITVLTSNIQHFLRSDILIINIPSKNQDYFASLLKEIEQSNIKKILFISSTSVYENVNKPISESDGLESALSPLFAIETLFSSSKKIKMTIVRFGGLIGYGRNPGYFFAGGKCLYNPDSYVNLIHRDDCIGIISRIIEQEVWDEVFNCCADTHPTKRQFYTDAAKKVGLSPPTIVDTATKTFKIINNQKVKTYLNYQFIHTDLMNLKI